MRHSVKQREFGLRGWWVPARGGLVGLVLLAAGLVGGVAGGVAVVVGDWPAALPSAPVVDRESSPMGTVVSVEGAGVLTVRVEGRLEVVALVGVVEVDRAAGGVGVGDVGGSGVGGSVDAGVFLRGLLMGEPVRVVVSRDRGMTVDSAGRRFVRLFREPDGLYVNAELVRQGYAGAVSDGVYAERPVFRAYERRAREVGKGVWGLAAVVDEAGDGAGGEDAGPAVRGGDSARPAPVETKESVVRPGSRGGVKTVYVTRSGTKYHRVDCRHVRGDGVERVSVSQARTRGLEACLVCNPDEG